MSLDPKDTPNRLRVIADMLGVPVEQFFDATVRNEFADADECLRLWFALRTDQGRTSVLDHLRHTLAKESA